MNNLLSQEERGHCGVRISEQTGKAAAVNPVSSYWLTAISGKIALKTYGFLSFLFRRWAHQAFVVRSKENTVSTHSTQPETQTRSGITHDREQGTSEDQQHKFWDYGLIIPVTLLALLLITPLVSAQKKDAAAVAQEQLGTDQQSEAGNEGLLKVAKKAENPVSSIYKLQIQPFFNPNMGKNDVTQYTNQVILTIPFHLSRKWDLLTRTSVPVSYLPAADPGKHDAAGLGDLNPTLYLSPTSGGKLSWGVGPSFQLDTATDSALGSGKQSMGPAAAGTLTTKRWVIGTRINNMWSFAGTAGRKDFNTMWIQPFVWYNFRPGWFISTVPTISADWKGNYIFNFVDHNGLWLLPRCNRNKLRLGS